VTLTSSAWEQRGNKEVSIRVNWSQHRPNYAPDAFPGASAEWADGGERRWRERLLDTTALKVVAVRDGGTGRSGPRRREDGCAWLHSLWVSPQVRGQGTV